MVIKGTIIATVLGLAVLFTGCRSNEKAAQRHLIKAMKLDPKIFEKATTDTTIKGFVNIKVSLPVPEHSTVFFVPDSLLVKKKVFVFEKEKQWLSAIPTDTGYNFRTGCKADTVRDSIKVPYAHKVIVPGKVVIKKEYIELPFYKDKYFWASLVLGIFLTIVIVARLIK